MRKLQFCLTVFAVLALTFSAFAQVENGQFTGTVTDPTGAAIASAQVTVSNAATQLKLTNTTNASGNFVVKEVPPGTYKITVEGAGFKTFSDNGVTANAGTISHIDAKLQIGKASEVVEVTGEAAIVNTEDSKLATTVSSTQINNLPLNGRNVFDLMQMSTGAVNVTGVDFENGHGTVVNDKVFFCRSFQGDSFISAGTPITTTQETSAWRTAVTTADTNAGLNSTAALLYGTFPTTGAPISNNGLTSNVYVTNYAGSYGLTEPDGITPLPSNDFTPFLCPNWSGQINVGAIPMTPLQAQKMASIFGVTAADQAQMGIDGCTAIPGATQTGTINRVSDIIQENSVAVFKSQTGNLPNPNLFNQNQPPSRLPHTS